MSNRTSQNRDPMEQTYQNDAFYNSSLSYKEDEVHQKSRNSDSPGQRQETPKSHTPSNVNQSYTHQPDQGRHDVTSKAASQNMSEGDRKFATVDPFLELKQGKSEKEVLAHLKHENAHLREELKKVSDDLTMLLEKKKIKKNNKASMPVKDIVNNEGKSEEVIATELKTAEKQLARLKKELDTQKSRFDNEGTFDKYEKLKENVAEKDAKAQRIKDEKKALDKTIRETEKKLQMLCNEQETNLRINNLEQEVRLEREKLKEVEKRCELLKQHEARRKEYVAEIQNDITNVKADIQKASTTTHVNPDEIQKSHGEGQRVKTKESLGDTKTKKVPISKHLEPEPPVCNADNFDKLKKEIRILEKADEQRGKALEKKVEELREQLNKLTKQNEDAKKKVAEKNKEILILQTKTKDISRIVRHHAVAPLQREERNLQLRSSSKELQDYTVAPGIKTRKAGERSPNPKDGKTTNMQQQAGVGESLTEYARKKFYAKGYRKDERGQLLPEGEGENWNDKDVVGKHKVKIIAIDIWHDDDVICGVQAVYEDSKGEVIEGPPHIINPEACKMTTFETLEEDYVKEISGFMNKSETVVECLIMKTYRGDSMKIGKPSKDGKFFRFDINELEYPAVLYGSVKEDKKTTRGKLTRFGVLISAQLVEEVIKNEPTKEDEKKEENNESTVHKEKSEHHHEDSHNKSDLKSKKTLSEKNQSKNDVDQSRLSKGNKSGMHSKDGEEEEEEQQEEDQEGQEGEEEQQEEEYEEGEQGEEEGEYEENQSQNNSKRSGQDDSRRESNKGDY